MKRYNRTYSFIVLTILLTVATYSVFHFWRGSITGPIVRPRVKDREAPIAHWNEGERPVASPQNGTALPTDFAAKSSFASFSPSGKRRATRYVGPLGSTASSVFSSTILVVSSANATKSTADMFKIGGSKDEDVLDWAWLSDDELAVSFSNLDVTTPKSWVQRINVVSGSESDLYSGVNAVNIVGDNKDDLFLIENRRKDAIHFSALSVKDGRVHLQRTWKPWEDADFANAGIDGNSLAVLPQSNTVLIRMIPSTPGPSFFVEYDLNSGTPSKVDSPLFESVANADIGSVVFDSNGAVAAAAGRKGNIYLIDWTTKKMLNTYNESEPVQLTQVTSQAVVFSSYPQASPAKPLKELVQKAEPLHVPYVITLKSL